MAKKKQNTEKQNVSSQELNSILNFYEQYMQGYQNNGALWGLRNKYYTPDIINQTMQSINMNPSYPNDINDVINALKNPKSSESILRNYATYFELTNMLYKRVARYIPELLAWNLTFDSPEVDTLEQMQSKEYQEDLKKIDQFCGRFNSKDELTKIVTQIIRQGVYYGVLRDEKDTISWQQLPSDYCKITGNSPYGYLYSFNFGYFMQAAGTNIDMFPSIFKKLYRNIVEESSAAYNPKGKINNRNGVYIYWADLSPKDNFFCFTMNDGIMTLVPYYSSMFPDMCLQPMMRDLEKDKAIIAAKKILVGILDTYDNAKSGTIPNQFTISPATIGKFMSLVSTALGDSVKAVTLPVKEAEVVDFAVENQNRYTNYQRNIAANMSSSSASLLTENKLNAFESQHALTIDENFAKSLYGQFEKFLNYYMNKDKKLHYKFVFKFNDTNSSADRKARAEKFHTNATMGLVSIFDYARACDKTIFEAKRDLLMTKAMKLEDSLVSLLSLNNQSTSQNKGRPSVDETTNDSTMDSIDRGSNELTQEIDGD